MPQKIIFHAEVLNAIPEGNVYHIPKAMHL